VLARGSADPDPHADECYFGAHCVVTASPALALSLENDERKLPSFVVYLK
jgi:hypothetical protein